LTSHNFLSAAAGIAMAAAVIRGFARRSAKTIGNFWIDLTRATLWVLMPISAIFALFLVWQGVPDNFSPYVNATTLEGATQTIAEGPVASQEIIKELSTIGIDQHASAAQSGGNMEGKEVRFGIVESAMWATVTTDTSCGAVNAMHDSFTPLGGLVPMVNMQLGEVIFGGVGSGLYGIIVMAVLAVFIAGLMVGRTPEY